MENGIAISVWLVEEDRKEIIEIYDPMKLSELIRDLEIPGWATERSISTFLPELIGKDVILEVCETYPPGGHKRLKARANICREII
jgi:hypothetical protein